MCVVVLLNKLEPGGKPSTWYPPGEPLELEKIQSRISLLSRKNIWHSKNKYEHMIRNNILKKETKTLEIKIKKKSICKIKERKVKEKCKKKGTRIGKKKKKRKK